MPTRKFSIIRHENMSTFVPAEKAPQPPTTIAPLQVPDLLPPTHLSGYARQDDDALTHARATLLVSAAYIIAAGMITAGLLLLAWLFRGLGDHWAVYAYVGVLVWGVAVLLALYGNRRQSLHHSPTGVSHHELDSRERLARHAIDTQADLLLRRWERDDDR
jgi:hypothetical protein